jgi:hypothetical protein
MYMLAQVPGLHLLATRALNLLRHLALLCSRVISHAISWGISRAISHAIGQGIDRSLPRHRSTPADIGLMPVLVWARPVLAQLRRELLFGVIIAYDVSFWVVFFGGILAIHVFWMLVGVIILSLLSPGAVLSRQELRALEWTVDTLASIITWCLDAIITSLIRLPKVALPRAVRLLKVLVLLLVPRFSSQ